ncbi:MAG: hypothetical protein WCG27_08270, partial [Pseudomonadota bacterium]
MKLRLTCLSLGIFLLLTPLCFAANKKTVDNWGGPFEKGHLILRADKVDPVDKGAIQRVTLAFRDQNPAISVSAKNGTCVIMGLGTEDKKTIKSELDKIFNALSFSKDI